MSESTTQQLITDLENRGVRVLAKADQLVLDAPKGVLTPHEVERIRAYKAALLTLLAARKNQERTKADRLAKRGYDFDSSAPSANALRQAALEEARAAGQWLPPCPVCHAARYWLTLTGNVICGSCCAAYWRVEELRVAPLQ